jgi:hypothetical protein
MSNMARVADVAYGVRLGLRLVQVTRPELPSATLPIPCLMGRCLLVAIIDVRKGIGSVIYPIIIKEV